MIFQSPDLTFNHHLVNASAKDCSRIEQTVRLLKEHTLKGFPGITLLAREAGISSTKLKYLFKSLTGSTVYSYYNSCQMVHARNLLLEDHDQIKMIAYKLCYKHPGKFTEAFRRYYGITPSEMRSSKESPLLLIPEESYQLTDQAV